MIKSKPRACPKQSSNHEIFSYSSPKFNIPAPLKEKIQGKNDDRNQVPTYLLSKEKYYPQGGAGVLGEEKTQLFSLERFLTRVLLCEVGLKFLSYQKSF